MIGALAVVGDQAQRLFRVDRGIDQIADEQLAAGMVRAAEGREDAPFFEELERAQVDLLIAAHGVHERLFVPGEARWVEDDQVVFRRGVLEEIEDVVLNHFDFEAIELSVATRCLTSACGNIHGRYVRGSRLGAGQGEAALVGEAIEHAFARGEFGDFGVGLELATKWAGPVPLPFS